MIYLPEVLDKVVEEMNRTVTDMSRCKDLDDRLKYADILKSLSNSLGVFFESLGMMDPDFIDDIVDFEDDSSFSEDIVDFNSLKKDKRKGKGKKKNKSDDDIPF